MNLWPNCLSIASRLSRCSRQLRGRQLRNLGWTAKHYGRSPPCGLQQGDSIVPRLLGVRSRTWSTGASVPKRTCALPPRRLTLGLAGKLGFEFELAGELDPSTVRLPIARKNPGAGAPPSDSLTRLGASAADFAKELEADKT